MTAAALLLLADGRLPSGAHAHSGGLEPIAGLGLIRTLADIESFLRGRLHTSALVTATLAAAAAGASAPVVAPTWDVRGADAGAELERLDHEADARMPSPTARTASRTQGRQLLRSARTVWPSPLYDALPRRPHHPIVLGMAATAAGLTPADAALAAAHGSVTGSASAAVRLLSLDPIAVHALLARFAPEVDAVATAATAAAERGEIPAPAAPLLELAAEDHATWEVRLFAS